MPNVIYGKVARILNTRELAINVGGNSGVEEEMVFEVLSSKGGKIVDPESGEELGNIHLPKVRVKIVSVHDKWSLASTYQTKRVNVGGYGHVFMRNDDLLKAFQPPKWVDKVETLKSTEERWEDLDDADSYVKIGDTVVQVTRVREELEKLPELPAPKSTSASTNA